MRILAGGLLAALVVIGVGSASPLKCPPHGKCPASKTTTTTTTIAAPKTTTQQTTKQLSQTAITSSTQELATQITTVVAATPTTPAVVKVAGQTRIKGTARFFERQANLSSLGNFQGAPEAWRMRVLLVDRKKSVGYSNFGCIYVIRTIRECLGTYILPKGRIQVAGIVSSRSSFQLTVVGGTGTYQAAQGVLTATGTAISHILIFNFV